MTELLEAVEPETGKHPTTSVIRLHGLGADGHDFEAIVLHIASVNTTLNYRAPAS